MPNLETAWFQESAHHFTGLEFIEWPTRGMNDKVLSHRPAMIVGLGPA